MRVFFCVCACYSEKMKTLLQLPMALATKSQQLLLGVITKNQRNRIAEVIAAMALNGSFSIVTGSERIPSYEVTRLLDDDVCDLKAILDRIHLRRSFTCYQLVDVLKNTLPIPEPLLILDFLYPFYEDIPVEARINRFDQCIEHLERLSASRPIGMIIQDKEGPDFSLFYPDLERIADEIFQTEDEVEAVSQPRLFN
jgi:hypothetical protein